MNFLQTQDFKNRNYLSKNHFLPDKITRHRILTHPDIRMLLIIRDPKDMVVSYFFHEKRLSDSSPRTFFPWIVRGNTEFEQFYWRQGRKQIRKMLKFLNAWTGVAPNLFITRYELLHEDFHAELARMACFLNCNLTPADACHLQERTSFRHFKSRSDAESLNSTDHFLRKGQIGDHKNYFTPAMVADADLIAGKMGMDVLVHQIDSARRPFRESHT
jgi:hypothetical protein